MVNETKEYNADFIRAAILKEVGEWMIANNYEIYLPNKMPLTGYLLEGGMPQEEGR